MNYEIELTESEAAQVKNTLALAFSNHTVSSFNNLNDNAKNKVEKEFDRFYLRNVFGKTLGEDWEKITTPLWKKAPSQFHDLLAWKTYRERYVNLCNGNCPENPGRRQVIDQMMDTLTPEEIYNAVKDTEITKDTYKINIEG